MNSPEQPNSAGLGTKYTLAFANPVWLCLLLVAVTLAVYWPVIRCDFLTYDDPEYFASNIHVLGGLTRGNVIWAFTTGQTGNWHPLTWLSLMLDAELFGRGPAGPHFTNLLFHSANAVLLFLLLRRLTTAMWRSVLVAALFALHPLHVESVAWVAERKDVLSTFFGLLALGAWGRCVEKSKAQSPKSWVFYGSALGCFALGLMSKPMLVTLPFVMLLLDWWPLERFKVQGSRFKVQSLIWGKIPFFVLSAISCVVTFIAQQKGGAVIALVKISLAQRMENALVSYARYLEKMFWPVSLANPYPYVQHWSYGVMMLTMALFFGLGVAAACLGRKYPFGFTGWFWFVGTLVPVIGLVQVGGQAMADRYSYLPLTGLFIILVWGGAEACARWHFAPRMVVLGVMIILITGAVRTRDQVACWRNDGVLFRHALAVTENNYVACVNLGAWLSAKGDVQGALGCYHYALQMSPSDPLVLYDLGNGFAKFGMWDEAIANYRHALEMTPDQADILNNLGFALATKKQFAGAVACFEAALKRNPDYADAHNNLATVLFIQKRFDEAVRHFREALHITPGNPQICNNLGDALVKQGQTAEAVKTYQEALRLKPGDAQIKAKLQALGVPISN